MPNQLHQLTKISLTAILLAILAWIALDGFASGASGNTQQNLSPSFSYVEARATATPRVDVKLNQLASQSRPTECALTRLYEHDDTQNRAVNRAMLEALTPPHPATASLSTAVLGAATIQPVRATIAPIWHDLQQTLSTNAAQTADYRRTLGSCIVTTPADSGSGTLRQCLLDITANGTITFDPQVFPPSAPTTISLSSVLRGITTDGLTIDGSTAGVVLDGTSMTSSDYGLGIDGANGVTIKGLQIVNFSGAGILMAFGASNNVIGGNNAQARNIIGGNQIGIAIGASSNNKVIGNYIGTDATGTTAWPNELGVGLATGAQNNVIGGAGSEGNLISGNEIGVHIEGTHNNFVLGNLIGTNATGTTALGNEFGVALLVGAQNNTIGGAAPGTRNIISGNTSIGIQIQDAGTNDNQVLGNFIGTDITGHTRLDNELGVGIGSHDNSQEIGPTNNLIGGAGEGARNIIGGNRTNGIEIVGTQSTNNRIEGNYIGTNVEGTASLKNRTGILIRSGAHHNTIGGDQPGTGNLISGNEAAIGIFGNQTLMTTDNLIQGNYIGTDVSGTASLPNTEGIVILENAHRNIIGGTSEQARNIISGNEKTGVWIGSERTRRLGGSSISENQVVGNYIGTDVTGQVALGNEWGVTLNESQNNIVGCDSLEGCNIISGNRHAGIIIQQEASDNQVMGNFIGTDLNGTRALANDVVGIGIIEGSHHNIIGGNAEGTRNVISGNRESGVDIRHADTSDNQIVGNYIGTDKSGTSALSNRWGVAILQDAHHNIIGGNTEGTRNLISGNSEAGVQIQGFVATSSSIGGSGADHNRVQGNYIGTDVTGLQSLGNRWGIDILAGAKNNLIGGTEEAEGNLISGNLESGIELLNYLGHKTRENKIKGNQIGIAADGSSPLGNGFAGVCLFLGTNSNTIGPNNTIAHNADAGVRIQDSGTENNTITENAIYDNSGLPIDLIGGPQPISPPILNNWTNNVVEGSACAGCRIEIFANPDATPAGTLFLGAETADQDGSFTITLPSDRPTDLSCLSATATDQAGTTFEFSDSLCDGDPPIATSTPTVSNSPTATPTVSDSTATPTATVPNNPTATPTVPDSTATATPTAPDSTATATPTPVNASHTLYLPVVIR